MGNTLQRTHLDKGREFQEQKQNILTHTSQTVILQSQLCVQISHPWHPLPSASPRSLKLALFIPPVVCPLNICVRFPFCFNDRVSYFSSTTRISSEKFLLCYPGSTLEKFTQFLKQFKTIKLKLNRRPSTFPRHVFPQRCRHEFFFTGEGVLKRIARQ